MRYKTLLIALLTTTLSAGPTGKTFFSQSISPAWLDPFAFTLPHEEPPVGNGMRSALHIEPFYWRSTNKKKLGRYFGYHESTTNTDYNHIRVDADASETSLNPQDIIHDSENAASFLNAITNPLSETISFHPHIEQYGALIATTTHFGDSFVVHSLMPWVHVTHNMGIKKSAVVPQVVEGAAKTASDFFAGNLVQETATSPDQQDKLIYGKFLNNQSCSGLGDITILIRSNLVKDKHMHASLGGLLTVPTSSRANAHYLFEPLLGAGGHVVIGAHLNMETFLAKIKDVVTVEGLFNICHRIGLGAHEIRSPSYQFAVDNGIDAQFSRYALAGKKHTRRLFPLINALTQPVNVTPGGATDVALGLCAAYRWLHARLVYRFSHSEPEAVSPLVQWAANTYSVSRLDYKQTESAVDPEDPLIYNTFSPTTNGSTLTGPLLEENILFTAAATPSQSAHTLGFTLAGAPFKKWPHSSFSLRSSYTFTTSNSFGLDGFGLSAAFAHTF